MSSFFDALTAFVKTAAFEASRGGDTLMHDIEVRVVDHPEAVAIRFGFGDHDWRQVGIVRPSISVPGADMVEWVDWRRAVEEFTTAAVGHPTATAAQVREDRQRWTQMTGPEGRPADFMATGPNSQALPPDSQKALPGVAPQPGA